MLPPPTLRVRPLPLAAAAALATLAALAACSAPGEGAGAGAGAGRGAETAAGATESGMAGGEAEPVMLNGVLPFRYPPALYARRVQGNVTLRLWIDSTGAVVPDSTMVQETSGFPALDSAAVAGSHELRFRPAFSAGTPIAVAVLFPVYFRHPDAEPLPGDTILKRN